MRPWALAVVLAVLAFVSACAPKTAPVVAPGAPRFPDFVQPTVPAALAGNAVAVQTLRSWLYLQAGDLRSAAREASAALAAQPAFHPAQTTAAYIELARKDAKGAVAQFTRIADAHPDYAPALAGKGLALDAAGQASEAVVAFRAAVAADPGLVEIARRVDVLQLRGLQDELADARRAAQAGDSEAAIQSYRRALAASPDSAFLYVELAAVERQVGQSAAAVEHLQRALQLDPSDPATLVVLGDLQAGRGEIPAALDAYGKALALEPNADVEEKRKAVQQRADLEALPAQYRAIPTSPQVTRAELAALVAIRLPDLLQASPVRDIGVLTDIRGHWAERWMAPVARAGVVEAFPNHTFQPRALVRRVDLAQTLSRLLNVVAAMQPARAQAWIGARGRFSDMTTGHLAYPAVSMAVSAGAMTSSDGAFQPTRVVMGAEAVAALDRIRALAGPMPSLNRR
ncbi:MAG: tetratricopeptide repeat protein [Vicinamibacterales bacterium]